MEQIKKQFCLIYNTFNEMIKDIDVIEGMVIMTLGHDNIDDGNGALYKIIKKDDKGLKNIDGESFGPKSPYFAMKISVLNSVLSVRIALRKMLENNNKSFNEIEDSLKIIPDMISTNQIFNVLYLNDEETIKIVQCYNGMRYIINKEQEYSKIVKEIEITEENSWIIPTEFSITDFIVTDKKLGSYSNIKYVDGRLIFTVDFTKLKTNVISY